MVDESQGKFFDIVIFAFKDKSKAWVTFQCAYTAAYDIANNLIFPLTCYSILFSF